MFEDQGIADTAPPEGGAAPAAPERAMAGPVAARLAEALEDGSVVMVAASEARAEAIAGALRTLAPEAEVILFPAPDAIPGDLSLSSPAVAGRRTAALRRLGARGDRRVALVASVEAAAQPVAPPEAYAGTPRAIREGEAIDAEALGAELEALGYHHDDRIDEPGEVAVRGGVIELFPPAHAEPVRIEHHDGWVTSIRAYDPLTQRSDHAEQGVEIEPIAEPPVGADAVSLFAHLADSAIAIDPGSDERRRSLRALFEDARRLSETPSRVHLPLDDAGWTAALRGRARVDVAAAGERPCRRFAEPDREDREALRRSRGLGGGQWRRHLARHPRP
ncbi:MAG: hypothetical protein AVDCRST_MAG39-1452, partial [uncultured Sphingomonadaceae bacterium]